VAEKRDKCGKWDQTCSSKSKNHSYDAMTLPLIRHSCTGCSFCFLNPIQVIAHFFLPCLLLTEYEAESSITDNHSCFFIVISWLFVVIPFPGCATWFKALLLLCSTKPLFLTICALFVYIPISYILCSRQLAIFLFICGMLQKLLLWTAVTVCSLNEVHQLKI